MEEAREGILDRGNSRGCFGKTAIKLKSSYLMVIGLSKFLVKEKNDRKLSLHALNILFEFKTCKWVLLNQPFDFSPRPFLESTIFGLMSHAESD